LLGRRLEEKQWKRCLENAALQMHLTAKKVTSLGPILMLPCPHLHGKTEETEDSRVPDDTQVKMEVSK